MEMGNTTPESKTACEGGVGKALPHSEAAAQVQLSQLLNLADGHQGVVGHPRRIPEVEHLAMFIHSIFVAKLHHNIALG